mmetsp:Transcript_8483/g.17131  ORF Transcript_8483/g.17131 Transcript_8483/m.17131 type:complete len:653 (+) Transcript_8483:94-2052(+)
MTGKFTQNVYSLGYFTGKTLHHLAKYAGSLTTYVLSPESSLSGPASNITSKSNLISRLLLKNKPQSIQPPPTAFESLFDSVSTTFYNADLETIQKTLAKFFTTLCSLPSAYKTWWLNLLKSDPLHVLVETTLIVMCIILVVWQRRADWKLRDESKKMGGGQLAEKEKEELLKEWKEYGRKPLGGPSSTSIGESTTNVGTDVGSGIIVDKIEGVRLFIHPESKPYSARMTNGGNIESKRFPSSVLNFATLDYLGNSSSPLIHQTALNALSKYGCGSCGPRGFYGTIDAHLEIEDTMSSFLQTEGAVLYSDGASAVTSTVAAFAKRGDLLIVDEGVNEALLTGVSLSRANVRYFRHNDVKDLRRLLEKVRANDIALKRKPTDQRRFLVVEGLYRNWGTLAPLKEIVALKEEFHYRLILDDSQAMGTLGENGRGTLEHFGLSPMVHAEIVTFSLENAFGSIGGMTVGNEEVVDHQRLSGAGYCFSASSPPFLCKVGVASVRRIQGKLNHANHTNNAAAHETEEELSGQLLLKRLTQNTTKIYATLTDSSHPHALKLRNRLVITSHPLSPLIYLSLSDEEATSRTRGEQTLIMDKIAGRCFLEAGVAIVSTGGHVKKYLQLVPEPCLRITANVSQEEDDIEALVRALGDAVQSVFK